ncbi:hypothetical protein KUCAC02_013822, partial [Chaenocephalus aceratus]
RSRVNILFVSSRVQRDGVGCWSGHLELLSWIYGVEDTLTAAVSPSLLRPAVLTCSAQHGLKAK